MAEAAPSIPGIYNYCDRWCERCRFSERCFLFRSYQAAERGEPLPTLSASSPDRAELPILAEAYHVPPEIAAGDLSAEISRQLARLDVDPLKGMAEAYTFAAYPIVQALDPLLRDRNDDVAVAAVETLRHLAVVICSKTVRALHTYHTDGYDRSEQQSDAHGSAKVARLAIKESRDAWGVLTQVGRAAADGVPKRMIETLTALDTAIADRFPRAMEFVREGFDTD